ncbi:MAG TPA: hypothetical protein PKZ75_06260 [Bacteroidia bacterium]|nr:hypothetical protein [Bacteroidia bacterium]
MSQLISFKSLLIIMILILCEKASFSQTKPQQEIPSNLKLPDSYYKGIEAKRKYAEANKVSSTSTSTATTSHPVQSKKIDGTNPEIRAKSMLNTPNIPSDFPTYNSYSMSAKEYEEAVALWFKKNPSFRKTK